jgi:hypothetical protein
VAAGGCAVKQVIAATVLRWNPSLVFFVYRDLTTQMKLAGDAR